MAPERRIRQVSNDVLLEKINQVKDQSHLNSEKLEKLETSVNQNFSSMANILREGYTTKTEVIKLEADWKERFAEMQEDISKRLHKDTFKPYAWVLNTIGALGLAGFVGLVGKMIVDYLKGGPPQ